MRKTLLWMALLCLSMPCLWAQDDAVAQAQHLILGQNAAGYAGGQKVLPNMHPDAQWFPKAGLGLFIHFGVAAEHGGIDLSWGMFANKSWEDGEIKPDDYWQMAKNWNPEHFNPSQWIKLAKEAGFKYVVLTTKHHDGYTLWPSKYGEMGTHKFLNNRDMVQEFVDACRSEDLKIGLYFSPPDWYFDRAYMNWDYSGKEIFDTKHLPIKRLPTMSEKHKKRRLELTRGQLTELLTQYGKIDMLWFDGGKQEMTNDEVRALQPGIIINRRNGAPGDYADSEGVLPNKRFYTWFEANDPCWPERWWSYSTSDRMATANDVIERIVLMRTWGGNYLANLGPKGSGELPEEALAAWKVMAKWMEHSGESIFDTTAGNFPEDCNQPITWKGEVAYLHAYPNYHRAIELKTENTPKEVILLRTKERIPFTYKDGLLKVSIDPHKRTRMVDTVKVIW